MDTLGLAFTKAKEALALDDSDLKTRWELGKRRDSHAKTVKLSDQRMISPIFRLIT